MELEAGNHERVTEYLAPYWQNDDVRLYYGDCIATMRQLPAESVHCCVTSPPYWGLRSYLPDGHPDKAKELGLEETPEQYVARMVEVFREVRRVLRGDGTLWLNLGSSYAGGGGFCATAPTTASSKSGKYGTAGAAMKSAGDVPGFKPKDMVPIPWMVAMALQADGWYLRQDIIWHKPNPMPESVTDRPTKSHEYIFLLSKGPRYFYDAEAVKEASITNDTRKPYGSDGAWAMDGRNKWEEGKGQQRENADAATRNRRSVWTVATQPFPGSHFATFPPKLIEPCILAGCPDQCCPECGKGWVRVVEKTPGWDGSRYGDRAVAASGGVLQGGTTHSTLGSSGGKLVGKSTTIGFRPACSCYQGADEAWAEYPPIPGTVLDPFGGAATTGVVAHQLGRKAILCELSEEYCRMASDRLEKANAQKQLF